MFSAKLVISRSGQWLRTTGVVLAAVLILALSGGISASGGAQYLHPALLALARDHPTQSVVVIVQKTSSDGHLEKMVAGLGGEVTADLWIVNGFAARLPAAALPALAGAGGVQWISPDGAVQESGGGSNGNSTAQPANAYIKTIGADKAWNGLHPVSGQGIGVAVIDSGVTPNADFGDDTSRLFIVSANGQSFNEREKDIVDNYGHGTHVAGIIGGNGANSNGMYTGVAPKASLISLKVADNSGQGTASGVLQAAQWILVNHAKYNIRVVNMSFSSAVLQSYNVDPIDAVVELLWMNGIVVVVAAGNNGPNSVLTSPANDPFVIAVGAADDKGTTAPGDDSIAVFSSSGMIEKGISKPDIIAPGRHIVSVLADKHVTLAGVHSPNIVGKNYFMMSGTSMASPMVAGAAALLLQSHPNLTPNQVKGCLLAYAGKPPAGSNAKYLAVADIGSWDCKNATSNQAAPASQLMVRLVTQLAAGGLNLGPLNWGNVNWGNVNWGNVNWGNVN